MAVSAASLTYSYDGEPVELPAGAVTDPTDEASEADSTVASSSEDR
jgi:hypothetical protein